ncbi:MAG: UDP-3-O-(3-hydroxymyristoyl)glucosamine N-acyltransferase [Planctomycetota bacterium]|nr:UDP-3-O-(3-hydroxymyristoyl)glucosamine N-acyltransferase [Planctomycetota bacterium]
MSAVKSSPSAAVGDRAEPARPARTPLTSGSLATELGAELLGPADVALGGVESLAGAKPGDVTFIRDDAFAHDWPTSKAACAIVSRGTRLADRAGTHDPRPRLVVANADLAMIRVLELFAPAATPFPPGIHPTAVVDASARIDASTHIGPCCVVGAGAQIGPGVTLLANVSIGAHASIGAASMLHPGVNVSDRCIVGARCVLHANVSIGADGFGYVPNPRPTGPTDAVLKVPHIGNVVLGDAVEIGANSCVDRGKFGATTIGDGTKIDNLVQVGHNCRIGRCCILCGHVGLSGSVTVGDGAVLGGKVGVADGITIGAGAKVGAHSGVMNDIPPGETWMGAPAMPASVQRRNLVVLRDIADRLKTIAKGVAGGEH